MSRPAGTLLSLALGALNVQDDKAMSMLDTALDVVPSIADLVLGVPSVPLLPRSAGSHGAVLLTAAAVQGYWEGIP